MQLSIPKVLIKEPSKWQFWIFLSFLIKGILFALLIIRHDYSYIDGFWGATSGDTPGYLLPIENFISHGTYSPDYRMPGYGILYLPFAAFFSKAVACNLLTILQYILQAISVYVLALTSKLLLKSNTAFYVTFYLYVISTYSNMFDNSLLTESFTTAFLIFSVYFLVKYVCLPNKSISNLVLSGLFLTETIFLRPVFVVLLLLFVIILVKHFYKESGKILVSKTLFFILPFIVVDGTWTVDKYFKDKEFSPLTHLATPEFENTYLTPLFAFVQSWGGSYAWPDPSAEIRWFGQRGDVLPGSKPVQDKNIVIPDYIYTSKFNHDSLLILRQQLTFYIAHRKDSSIDSVQKSLLQQQVINKCLLYANSIKEEKPFLYYVKARLIYVKRFFIVSGTYNLFKYSYESLNKLQIAIKLFYAFIYWTVLIFCCTGLFFFFKDSLYMNISAAVTGIVLYTSIIHPIVLRAVEFRYLIPAYPFMLICAVYAILRLWSKITNTKLT